MSALDLSQGTLHIPDGPVIALSPDALLAAQRYVEHDAPSDNLIQGSVKGGYLKGKMGYGAQIHRVRVLGEKIDIHSLSPQDCQLWRQPLPQKRNRQEAQSDQIETPAADMVIPRSQDIRPRYRKNRPVFEVLGRGEEEMVLHLGDDPIRALSIFSSTLHNAAYRTATINVYHRGHLVLPMIAEGSSQELPSDGREQNGLIQALAVAATEMQARFPELLYSEPPKIIFVTFQGKPAAVVLPWSLYLLFQPSLLESSVGEGGPDCDVTPMTMTQARNLFYSYSKPLAPLLSEEERPLKVLEVTSNQKPVGAILSRSQWARSGNSDTFPGASYPPAEPLMDDRTFTIAATRHRLYLFEKQFDQEGQQNIYKPVFVTNDAQPVFAIVPWGWYQMMAAFFHPQAGTIVDEK